MAALADESLGAERRYRLAVWLLWSGILMLLATYPIAFVAYGRPIGAVVVFTFFYGVAAIIAATALGIYNRIKLRRGTGAQN
jgi:polyferredoxin